MGFCILIPTINRKDLLLEALVYYAIFYPNTKVLVWDNGNQDIKPILENMQVFNCDNSRGVAESWNELVIKAIKMGETNFLILNDDIILKSGEGAINQMIAKGDENTFHRPHSLYNWSAVLLRESIFKKVGWFDEGFRKCYFEDNDYEYRMKLKGIHIKREDALDPEVYENSASIKKDPSLDNFLENREFYIKKWGGLPDSEVYLYPYNNEEIEK